MVRLAYKQPAPKLGKGMSNRCYRPAVKLAVHEDDATSVQVGSGPGGRTQEGEDTQAALSHTPL